MVEIPKNPAEIVFLGGINGSIFGGRVRPRLTWQSDAANQAIWWYSRNQVSELNSATIVPRGREHVSGHCT